MSAGSLELCPFSQRLRERLRELARLTRAELPPGCRLALSVSVIAPGIDLDVAGMPEGSFRLMRIGRSIGDRTLEISCGEPESGDNIRDTWLIALGHPAVIRNVVIRRTSVLGVETDHQSGERYAWFNSTHADWRTEYGWSLTDDEIDRLRAQHVLRGQIETEQPGRGERFVGEGGFPILMPYSRGFGRPDLPPLE